jgi:anti-anti-sigma regulatory factor
MPISLFVSYSKSDRKYLDDLKEQLSTLERDRTITIWEYRMIEAGQEWEGEIDRNLATADIVLLLVSASFLASDYCYNVEMKKALERHESGKAVVIPVILRPVNWAKAPFAKLQALPTAARPVTSWEDRDEAFKDVADGVGQVAQRLLETRKKKPGFHVVNSININRTYDIMIVQFFYDQKKTSFEAEYDKIRDRLDKLVVEASEDYANIKIILDLSNVASLHVECQCERMIDLLVGFWQRVLRVHGKLILCGIKHSQISEQFRITRLDEAFDICETERDAVNKLTSDED